MKRVLTYVVTVVVVVWILVSILGCAELMPGFCKLATSGPYAGCCLTDDGGWWCKP